MAFEDIGKGEVIRRLGGDAVPLFKCAWTLDVEFAHGCIEMMRNFGL